MGGWEVGCITLNCYMDRGVCMFGGRMVALP